MAEPVRRPYPGGRPSKGDRHAMVTRVPRAAADVIIARAQEHGCSISEYVASVLCVEAGYPELAPIPAIAPQMELPMTG